MARTHRANSKVWHLNITAPTELILKLQQRWLEDSEGLSWHDWLLRQWEKSLE